MDDTKIVDLFWARSENALVETRRKYGGMLMQISYSLLSSHEDSEECVNDTYMSAWSSMPTDRPSYLGAYLAKIVRRLSIDRFRSLHRQKRNCGNTLSLELCQAIPDDCDPATESDRIRLAEVLNAFVSALPTEKRIIFVRRYFYSDSVQNIADRLGISVSKVKTTLFRTREELRNVLRDEEVM